MNITKLPKTYDSFLVELEELFAILRPSMALITLDSKKEFELFTNTTYSKKLLGCSIASFVVIWNKQHYEKLGCTKKSISQLIKHELVHIFFRKKFGTNKPKWLNEGLAMHLSGQQPKTHEPVSLSVVDLLHLHSQDLWNGKSMKLSYHKSFEIIKRIIKDDLNGENKK